MLGHRNCARSRPSAGPTGPPQETATELRRTTVQPVQPSTGELEEILSCCGARGGTSSCRAWRKRIGSSKVFCVKGLAVTRDRLVPLDSPPAACLTAEGQQRLHLGAYHHPSMLCLEYMLPGCGQAHDAWVEHRGSTVRSLPAERSGSTRASHCHSGPCAPG